MKKTASVKRVKGEARYLVSERCQVQVLTPLHENELDTRVLVWGHAPAGSPPVNLALIYFVDDGVEPRKPRVEGETILVYLRKWQMPQVVALATTGKTLEIHCYHESWAQLLGAFPKRISARQAKELRSLMKDPRVNPKKTSS
jgi:hypothetical protein